MRETVTARVQVGPQAWLACTTPALVLCATVPDGVRSVLADVEHLTRDRGWHAVGFLAYEAGRAFGLRVHDSEDTCPLAWFALYPAAAVREVGPPTVEEAYALGPLRPRISRERFDAAFGDIRAAIAAGDTYQVNFTFQLDATFAGEPASLFADLVAAQRGGHSVFLDTGSLVVCSASPELFFEIDGPELRARPMKGTARRGLTVEADAAARAGLAASAKNRAENVMVVDMVRNDLGRIAEVGSVSVRELFSVERYPTVWQMTSLVAARSTAPLADIFAALHPSASITGAPKVRTMEIIHALEAGPRGIYTGAIGHVGPDGNARFNVAIRTAVVDRRAGTVTFGVGSGIVWDSDASAEYEECLLKAAVLGRQAEPFDLLETLLWRPAEGWVLLEEHLTRLSASAGYFGIPLDMAVIRAALDDASAGAEGPRRVRLLVDQRGTPRVETRAFVPSAGPVRLAIAATPVDPDSVWLYHKTTNRTVYDQAREGRPGCDDVVLWNPAGEVTETTIANVVVEVGGARVTPPVRCGLLPGTFRAAMLASGRIQERPVRVDELRAATRIWVLNSVQGERDAVLVS